MLQVVCNIFFLQPSFCFLLAWRAEHVPYHGEADDADVSTDVAAEGVESETNEDTVLFLYINGKKCIIELVGFKITQGRGV